MILILRKIAGSVGWERQIWPINSTHKNSEFIRGHGGMQLKIKTSLHMKSELLQFAVVIRGAYTVLSRDMV